MLFLTRRSLYLFVWDARKEEDHHSFDYWLNTIGLLSDQLFPLSAIVQTMRKTRQTSEFLTSLGPFFVGKAVWKSSSHE